MANYCPCLHCEGLKAEREATKVISAMAEVPPPEPPEPKMSLAAWHDYLRENMYDPCGADVPKKKVIRLFAGRNGNMLQGEVYWVPDPGAAMKTPEFD